MPILLKRVYDPVEEKDGERYLVERLWPRGIRRDSLHLTAWLPDVAPSTPLRQWFGHDPAKWEEFEQRYRAELGAAPPTWQLLLKRARQTTITLLFSARDRTRNSAVVLASFLEEKLAREKDSTN